MDKVENLILSIATARGMMIEKVGKELSALSDNNEIKIHKMVNKFNINITTSITKYHRVLESPVTASDYAKIEKLIINLLSDNNIQTDNNLDKTLKLTKTQSFYKTFLHFLTKEIPNLNFLCKFEDNEINLLLHFKSDNEEYATFEYSTDYISKSTLDEVILEAQLLVKRLIDRLADNKQGVLQE